MSCSSFVAMTVLFLLLFRSCHYIKQVPQYLIEIESGDIDENIFKALNVDSIEFFRKKTSSKIIPNLKNKIRALEPFHILFDPWKSL